MSSAAAAWSHPFPSLQFQFHLAAGKFPCRAHRPGGNLKLRAWIPELSAFNSKGQGFGRLVDLFQVAGVVGSGAHPGFSVLKGLGNFSW
jgi:hypothetical protein